MIDTLNHWWLSSLVMRRSWSHYVCEVHGLKLTIQLTHLRRLIEVFTLIALLALLGVEARSLRILSEL